MLGVIRVPRNATHTLCIGATKEPMSISRARWSDTEKKAVLDCYHLATDADDFFVLLKNTLGASFFRRTVKAYLTFLNDSLLPKTDPRRPVYQSLCEANQKEITAHKAAEALLYGQPSVPTPVTAAPAVEPPATPVIVATTATPAPAPNYNWVTEEVDVVPRVPPGRVAPPSLFRDPALPTLTEALATQAAEHAAQPRPVVTPDPKALVPRHYPALPPKAKFTADELATVFGLHRTKVVDAFAYGFIQTLDGAHITYQTAQRVHDAMSEGHSFSEACRLVNPNSTGLLPMEALIEKVDPPAVEDPPAVVVPGTGAGKVTLQVDDWTVMGGPMNPKSVAKMAADLNTQGPFVTSVEVLKGPPALFQGGEVFPVVQSVEVPAQPAKTVEPGEALPGGESVQYAEVTRIKLNPAAMSVEDMANHILVDSGVSPAVAQAVTKALAEDVTAGAFEDYTLEAVRDGVITVAQAVDILNPAGTHKAVWALSLLSSGKITVAQCDRLLFAKSV